MTIEKNDPLSVSTAAEVLAAGNIAILPTDTVYGFSGIVDLKGRERKSCDERIRKIKGRGEDKPFIQLIASPEEIWNYTDDEIPSGLLDFWPGPLTLIVRIKDESPFDGRLKTVAFRCPGDGWLRELVFRTGGPIYSSSVNRSGSPVLSCVRDIVKEFGQEVSLVVCDGDKGESLPSTIVSVEGGRPRLVRQGAVDLGQLVG